jgi:hypothetical protein
LIWERKKKDKSMWIGFFRRPFSYKNGNFPSNMLLFSSTLRLMLPTNFCILILLIWCSELFFFFLVKLQFCYQLMSILLGLKIAWLKSLMYHNFEIKKALTKLILRLL